VNASELERLTFEHIGEPFIKAALRSSFESRREAWETCNARFAKPEAANVRPWYARGVQETILTGAAERFGLDAIPEKPSRFWTHREIKSKSGLVVLTAATTPEPCGLVAKADYRLGLAEDSQQSLFGEIELGSQVYVLLLTSPYRGTTPEDHRDNGYLPGSVYLAWPSRDCRSYVHEINLIERYSDIARGYAPNAWNESAFLKYVAQARRMAF
jgi:hypothetical protein